MSRLRNRSDRELAVLLHEIGLELGIRRDAIADGNRHPLSYEAAEEIGSHATTIRDLALSGDLANGPGVINATRVVLTFAAEHPDPPGDLVVLVTGTDHTYAGLEALGFVAATGWSRDDWKVLGTRPASRLELRHLGLNQVRDLEQANALLVADPQPEGARR